MGNDSNDNGFEASLRQCWESWQQAMNPTGGGARFPWRESLERWTQLLGTGASAQVQDLGGRFQQQAGDWLGTMQQVAAGFAGRDSSAADVAGAWREAVEEQGDAMLRWMLDAARGGNAVADQPWLRDVAQAVQTGFGHADWLNAPAFGPAREHQARWQALLKMQNEYQRRMEQYVDSIRGALDDAFRRFETKLAGHEAPGSQLTSARAIFDLWIDAAEEAYASVALSEDFQHIYADLANAQMRLQAATRHELERACELLGVPTRTEMDAAHRRIAELERLLRRMAAGNTQPAPERSEKPTVVKKKAASASLKTAAKKPAAKKTAAKKTAAKKSATTKSAAKKAPARGRSKA